MRQVNQLRGIRVILALAFVLAACGADESDATQTPGTTGAGTDTSSSLQEEDMDLVDEAVADLATRLGVSETDIEVISVEEVTWSDGSLGCPKPGEFYTQALVDGHRIVLGHGEKVYDYHSGGERGPFLCPNPESKDGGYDFVPPPGDDTR
jgi:hypothetical protein